MQALSYNKIKDYRYSFNGKEADNEWNSVTGSSLDFGARIYDSRLGRWLSVDPQFKRGPYLTPYNYSFNNPILFIEKDGNWPEKTHTAIIKAAAIKLMTDYGIVLKPEQISWMIQGSIDADKIDNQATNRSFIHYMKDPKVSKFKAEMDAKDWVNDEINKYASGNEDREAYMALGRAAHTMMDATSPTHAKQLEDGSYEPIENDLPGKDSKTGGSILIPGFAEISLFRVSKHVQGEGPKEAAKQMNKSIDNVLNVIGKAFNEKMNKGEAPNVRNIGIKMEEVEITAKKQ